MGWSIGYDHNWKRDIGYGVPAFCDHPECNEEVDRGLGCVCGGDPYGGENGCGLFFCGKHLYFSEHDDDPMMCQRCCDEEKSFEPKPDHPDWIEHKLNDPSWQQWRDENPEEVKNLKKKGGREMSEVDKKNVVEELPCVLTNEELLEMSGKLAGLHQQKLEVEGKKKEAVNDFGARIKKIEGEVHLLSNNVFSKKETRNVECRLDYDWAKGKKTLVRLDTGEQVSEEVISSFERQQHMDFVERENGKEEWPEEETAEETGDEATEEVVPETPAEEEQPEPEEEEDSCFASFDADNETCQGCSQAADCFKETPESKDEEVPAEEKSDDLPARHKCAKCGEFFEEPKDNEDEDDTTSCPKCGEKNWM